MGLSTCQYVDAWYRHGPDCRHDRGKAPPRLCQGRSRSRRQILILALLALCLSWSAAFADQIRIATFNAELERKGPGLLLRDILKGTDPQVLAFGRVVARIDPDILVLQGVDYDHRLAALSALRDAVSVEGPDYPHVFALRPNTGLQTGLDMDGDGRRGGPRDAQGYGMFSGQGGMAILSRLPIDASKVQDFSDLLWKDMPDAIIPMVNGKPFPSVKAAAVQRLSSVGHWVVPVVLETRTLDVMMFHASPPVFDGPEDRNGRRNHDELLFWRHYLDGAFGAAPAGPFVLLGGFTLDPVDGDGRKHAVDLLLDDPRLQDPQPMRLGPAADEPAHKGNPRLDTAAWPQPDPGHMRVDYVLPSSDITVLASGVHWPGDGTAEAKIADTASRHRMVWVDLLLK